MFLSLALGFLSPAPVLYDLVYADAGEEALRYDYFRSAEPDAPLVVVIHGGAWVRGDKSDVHEVCEMLVDEGFASASISYRLAPTHRWPAMIDDTNSALSFFKANSKHLDFDAARTGLVGFSAGAQLALLAGLDTADNALDAKAIVNVFGPTDLQNDFEEAATALMTMMVLGEALEPADERLARLSPVTFASADDPPVFTIHGSLDPLVPVNQAARLDEALTAVGVSVSTRIVEGMGHDIDTGDPATMEAVLEALLFLKQELD